MISGVASDGHAGYAPALGPAGYFLAVGADGRPAWIPPGSGAVPSTAGYIAEGLTSDNDSHGPVFGLSFQRGLWQTPDNAWHVIYNRGTLNGAGLSLSVATSTNGMRTWTNGLTLPTSGIASTADGVLFSSSVFWCAYGGNDGTVKLARLVYSLGAWTVGTGPETVGHPAGATSINPTLTIDGSSTIWVGALATDGTGSYLTVYHRTAPATYGASVVLGTPDVTTDPERSIRLATLAAGAGNIAALWTEHGQVNFTQAAGGAWGSTGALYTDPLMLDTYNGQFSGAFDAAGNYHVAYAGSGALFYLRRDAITHTWTARAITNAQGTSIPQVVVATGGVIWLLCQDQYTQVQAYSSPDSGATFTRALQYRHSAATATVSYPVPRVRCPAGYAGFGPPPALVEFSDASAAREKALAFNG